MVLEEETFTNLQTALKSIAEQIKQEQNAREQAERKAFFSAIPEDAKALYIHLSHRIGVNHPYIIELQEKYSSDNVLVTTAPSTSGQSFYDNHLDKIAEEKKSKQVIEPFERFSREKSIDAVIYLCNYLCDGYQSPIFPEDVITDWHIWRPIRVAEVRGKPLIVGYRNNFCFGVKCYEREYITKKALTRIVQI